MCINVACCADIAVPQPLLNFLQAHAIGIEQTGVGRGNGYASSGVLPENLGNAGSGNRGESAFPSGLHGKKQERQSGGQKQRLAIACAVFSGRRILILDESTSGLDGQNMRLIAERLKSEARSGRTILVITHDRELIESCCDNIVEVEKRSS